MPSREKCRGERFTAEDAENAEKRMGLGYAICNESFLQKILRSLLVMKVNNYYVTLRLYSIITIM